MSDRRANFFKVFPYLLYILALVSSGVCFFMYRSPLSLDEVADALGKNETLWNQVCGIMLFAIMFPLMIFSGPGASTALEKAIFSQSSWRKRIEHFVWFIFCLYILFCSTFICVDMIVLNIIWIFK